MSFLRTSGSPAGGRSRPRRRLAALAAGTALAVSAVAAQADATTRWIYVTDLRGNTVSVLDPTTHAVVATVPVGRFPEGAAVTPDGSQAWVVNDGSNSVSVIDTATNTVVSTIPVGLIPGPLTFKPDGSRAYVGENIATATGGVAVIDTSTATVIANVPTGNQPFSLAAGADGSRVYSANFVGGSVSVIDTATNTVSATISGNGIRTPTAIVLSPDGATAYLVDFNANALFAINTATNAVSTVATGLGGPEGLAITPDGSRLYVADANANTVSVVDTATGTVSATIPVGRAPVSTLIDGTTVYVADDGSNTVSVIDAATNTVTDTIAVGSAPFAMAQQAYRVVPPIVTGISPASGVLAGNTTVTITGSHLTDASQVLFGTVPATNVTVVDDTRITVTAPPASAVGPVDVTVTTPAGTSATGAADQYTYTYPFTGFFAPVANLPTLNQAHAGQAVPLSFSLGGDAGLGVLASGSPTATQVDCATGAPVNTGTLTDTAGGSGLQYNPATGVYTYVWKTQKSWSGTCQLLTLTLNDGTGHAAEFQFVR